MTRVARRILLAAAMLLLPVLASGRALAISSEEVFTKVLVNNIETCYKNALVANIDLSSYNGFNSLMNDGYKQAKNTQYGLYIPAITDNYNKITETDSAGARLTSCYALFNGDVTGAGTLDGNMKGLFEIYGKTVPGGHNNVNSLNDFMGNQLMQYSINTEEASSNEYCYNVYVKESTTAATPVNLGSTCVNEDNYPLSVANNVTFSGGEENSGYTMTGGVQMTGSGRSTRVGFNVTITSNTSQCYDGGRSMKKCSSTLGLSMDVPEEGTVNFPTSQYWYNAPSMYVEITKKAGDSEGSKNVSYSKDNSKWRDFVTALTGKSYNDFAFSDAEKYDFYLQYLKMNYGRNGTSIGSTTCQANKPSSLADASLERYYIYIKGSGWCLANLDSNKINTQHVMTVFATNNNRTLTTYVSTLPELIELMGRLNYDDDSEFIEVDQSGEADASDTVLPTGETTQADATCGNSGGAMSLGWIVCPILEWMGGAVEGIYEDYLEPQLEIQPTLFDGNNYTYDVWQTFQGFANVVFIIVLLVVIFSQLTGVGIDNYGIKKTLPKLIVAAILVNLSYIICMVCVDLSNILGNAFNGMFQSLGPTGQDVTLFTTLSLGDNASAGTLSESAASAVGSTAITGVAILAALVAMGGMIWSNPAVLLSLLVGALGVLIAILFIFILLAARQAAIVVLVVISPLAFVCYMLPNTKKLFDRWLKMGQGLLLLYPICGLLIGGGDFVSRLLLNAGAARGSFVSALTAMLIGIVPFFFIPTVLKSSFAAMGSLGAKISGFGQRLGGRVTSGARNSNAYKDAQQRGQERQTRIRAGVDKEGNARNLGRFGMMMRGGKKGVAAARSQYLKDQDTRQRAERLAGAGAGFEAARISQQKAAEKDETGDYMTLINEATRNGENEDALYAEYEKYMSQGNKAGAVAAARIAGRRKDTAARFAERYLSSGELAKSDSKMARSVAKEISTGENSQIFRNSAPLQFHYASKVNSGEVGSGVKYEDWVKDKKNVDEAMSAFVTKSDELTGVKGSGLREIAGLMENGGMSESESARLQTLARDTINNRSRIAGWDSTKAAEIGRIAGWTYHEDGTFTDASGNIVGGGDSTEISVPHDNGGAPAPATAPAPTPAPGPAPASGSGSPIIMTATGHESIDELRRMAGQGGRPS